jgi:hypothetical protein
MLSYRPTLRGCFFIGIAVVALLISMIKPSVAYSMIASVCISLVISSFILSWFSLSGIEVTRDILYDGVLGENLCLPINVKNNSGSKSRSALVRESFDFSNRNFNEFALPSLAPGEEKTIERYVLPRKRGKFQLCRIELTGGDPAGLFKRLRRFDLPAELTIFPAIERISSLDLKTKTRICSTVSTRPLGISGQGEDIFGLREYRHGDPVRFVNWKATLRQKNVIVKEFESNEMNRISLLLDVDERYVGYDSYDSNFEYLVKTAASIMHYLSGMYCETSFITYYGEDKTFFRETGSPYNLSGKVDGLLSVLQPSDIGLGRLLESSIDFLPEDSILYCLTMSADDNLYKYFDQLSGKSIDIRWLFAPPECFPKIIPGGNSNKEDTSLFGYGMHSPTPFVVERGLELDDALAGG